MSRETQKTAEHRLSKDFPFSPVRPSGLGQMRIGLSGEFDKSKGVGWRRVNVTVGAADGSTTYDYHGQVQHSGLSGRGTEFMAKEVVDQTQRLIWCWISYGTPIEQTFQFPLEGWVRIRDVVKVQSEYRNWTASYFTTVTTAKGQQYKFETSQDGEVIGYEDSQPFMCA